MSIPTAEEFLKQFFEGYHPSQYKDLHDVQKERAEYAMIEYAKLHVEAALKAKIEAMEEYMNDGYDLEVFLGKEYNSKISRFYIADFDLSENITKYDKDTIKRISWSLTAVEYFPRENNKKLLDLFLKAYTSIAKIKGINDIIVQNIVDEYLS
jgi:hypothetical protein